MRRARYECYLVARNNLTLFVSFSILISTRSVTLDKIQIIGYCFIDFQFQHLFAYIFIIKLKVFPFHIHFLDLII